MKTILYKNTTISYAEFGNGPSLVLLHGFLENKKMWLQLIPELSKKNRVITIDLFGHGDSDCIGYIHTMEEQAEMVKFILDNLKIQKTIIAGHSMGGYIGLAFSELFPKKTKGLILINSTSKEDSIERKINRDRAIKAVKQNHTNFVRLSISNLFSEENRTKLLKEIENTKVEALKTPLQGIIASLEGMKIRKDRQFILNQATFPVLIVLGKKDPVLSYTDNLNQTNNESVRIESLPDGHMSHIENKDKLLEIVTEFIRN